MRKNICVCFHSLIVSSIYKSISLIPCLPLHISIMNTDTVGDLLVRSSDLQQGLPHLRICADGCILHALASVFHLDDSFHGCGV